MGAPIAGASGVEGATVTGAREGGGAIGPDRREATTIAAPAIAIAAIGTRAFGRARNATVRFYPIRGTLHRMNDSKRIAVVTGANRGIGLEIGRQLARLGQHVVLTSRDEAKGREAKDELAAEGLGVRLGRMHLAARELPVAFEVGAGRPQREQERAVALDHRRDDHDRRRHGHRGACDPTPIGVSLWARATDRSTRWYVQTFVSVGP